MILNNISIISINNLRSNIYKRNESTGSTRILFIFRWFLLIRKDKIDRLLIVVVIGGIVEAYDAMSSLLPPLTSSAAFGPLPTRIPPNASSSSAALLGNHHKVHFHSLLRLRQAQGGRCHCDKVTKKHKVTALLPSSTLTTLFLPSKSPVRRLMVMSPLPSSRLPKT